MSHRMRTMRAAAVLGFVLLLFQPATAQINLLGEFRLLDVVQAGDLKEAEALLVRGEVPDVQDSQGRTALMLAAIADNDAMIRILIRNRARPDIRDILGNTALGYAATHGNLGAVRAMAEMKVDLNATNRHGQTPLMLAAAEGRIGVVQYLLERGANAKLNDFTGRSALGWAEHNRMAAVARVLRAAGYTE